MSGNTAPIQITGVEVKALVTHTDSRGFFREVIRSSDSFFGEGFGQLSHTMSFPGVCKAWHIHQTQVDWWYVPIGAIKVALHDLREGSETYKQTQELYLGDTFPANVLRIPPGVAHGYRVIGGVTHLFYVTSTVYNSADEGRISHDDPTIGYDWLAGPSIT